jgi:hypothetical protein
VFPPRPGKALPVIDFLFPEKNVMKKQQRE